VEHHRELLGGQAELTAERRRDRAGPQPLLEGHAGGEIGGQRQRRQYLDHPDPRHAGEYKISADPGRAGFSRR
jgi:hypothetical protein